MPREQKIFLLFRWTAGFTILVIMIAAALTFEAFHALAMNLVVNLMFASTEASSLQFFRANWELLSRIAQAILQAPILAACVFSVGAMNFWPLSRTFLIALLPLVCLVEFIMLRRGESFISVVFAPIPLLACALFYLCLSNPLIRARFSERRASLPGKGIA